MFMFCAKKVYTCKATDGWFPRCNAERCINHHNFKRHVFDNAPNVMIFCVYFLSLSCHFFCVASIKSLWFLFNCIWMAKRKEKIEEVLPFQWIKGEEGKMSLSSSSSSTSLKWTHKTQDTSLRYKHLERHLPCVVLLLLLLLCRSTINDITKYQNDGFAQIYCILATRRHLTWYYICCVYIHSHMVWHGMAWLKYNCVYILAFHSFFKASQGIVLSNQIQKHVYNSNSHSCSFALCLSLFPK